MKKNITINLYGSLFAIDEDACALLERYLDNMKGYFARRAGGEEIADDVERRVAELFGELKAEGIEAISIEHVTDIISRIGNPEEMEGVEEDEAQAADAPADGATAGEGAGGNGEGASANAAGAAATAAGTAAAANDGMKQQAQVWLKGRRLYRDTEHRMFGGVLSGLCAYFGATDPLPWRILAIILFFFSYSVVGILYLVAWAIVPAALTDEQRLRMRGIPVTPDNINRELMRRTARPTDFRATHVVAENGRTLGATVLSILFFLLKLFCTLVVAGGLVTIVVFAILLLNLLTVDASLAADVMDYGRGEVLALQQSGLVQVELWGALLAGFMACTVALYVLIRSLVYHGRPTRMSGAVKATLGFAFAFSLLAGIVLCIVGLNRWHSDAHRVYVRQNTVNGVFADSDTRDFMERSGWTLVSAKGCNADGDYLRRTDDFEPWADDLTCLSFIKDEGAKNMALDVRQTKNLSPGLYKVRCVARVKGTGLNLSFSEDGRYWQGIVLPPVDKNSEHSLGRQLFDVVRTLGLSDDTLTSLVWETSLRQAAGAWGYYEMSFAVSADETVSIKLSSDDNPGQTLSRLDLLYLDVVPTQTGHFLNLDTAAVAAPPALPASK